MPPRTIGSIYHIRYNEAIPTLPEGKGYPCDRENLNCTLDNTADGKSYRSFIAVNSQIPGRTLIVKEGATVVVDVTNDLLTEKNSILWHGMHQKKTPWMDDVGYITHCPIKPESSFRYIFEATPAGTF